MHPRTRARRAPARHFWLGLLVLGSAICTGACTPNTEEARPYAERIAERRAQVEQLMNSGDSPVLPATRAQFLPLSYFPVDESYVASAELAPSQRAPAFEMPTSTGQRRQMRRAGTLKFALKGQPLELTAFVEAEAVDMRRLFVPFADRTNGTETYAAGRYLDLDRTPTGLYEVDFNKAYHPYCFFNPTYDCPYPPSENRLPLPVRAGERIRPTR